MPRLLFGEDVISFGSITQDTINALPVYVRKTVEIISRWNSGQDTFLLHTSGSTDEPKAIALKREHIIHSAKLTASTFGLKKGDLLFCCLPVDKVAGFMMVMRALVNECDLMIRPPVAEPLEGIDGRLTIDFAALIPMQLQAILEAGYDKIKLLNRTKAIIVGGADISGQLLNQLQIVSAPVYHTYGMTETYAHVAVRRLNGPYSSKYYRPLSGVDIWQDERDCLVISSAVTDHEPLMTNDIVEINGDNTFRFLGRADLTINSGGIKIQPEEIEKAAYEVMQEMKLPGRTVAATGIHDEKLGQKLVLVIEDEPWEDRLAGTFLDALRNKLDKYKSPKELRFTSQLPLTVNGKVDRRALHR